MGQDGANTEVGAVDMLSVEQKQTAETKAPDEQLRKYRRIWTGVRRAIAIGFFVPFAALNVIAMVRSMEGVSSFVDASTGEYGGEFDPAMGAEISSKNGRALVVVHEGFGEDVMPIKYRDDKDYHQYLKALEETKESYLENGDVVVVVYDQKGWFDDEHKPQKNVLHFATLSNNGMESPSVVVDGVVYHQSFAKLFDTLKRANIDTVEMAGEFRSACVSQVSFAFKDGGFKTGWCAECAYPPLDKVKYPENFPTLVPVASNQYSPLTKEGGLKDQNTRVHVQKQSWNYQK